MKRPMSQETRNKIRITRLGKRWDSETKLKISNTLKGRFVRNKSHFEKGHIAWNKGKPSPFKSIPRSLETKRRMSITLKAKHVDLRGFKNPFYGRHHTKAWKEEYKKKRAMWLIPYKDTKPEVMLQSALSQIGIKFEKHKLIQTQGFYHQVDIFIEPNICIEVDGDHWHTLPHQVKRDVIVNEMLERLGHRVFRFWEHEVYNDMNNVLLTIKTAVAGG